MPCRQYRNHRRHLGDTGDPYWDAMYAVAQAKADSCPLCEDAPEAVSFLHDVINVKSGRPLYDAQNYYKWLKIAERGAGR